MTRDIDQVISDAVESDFGWVLLLRMNLDSGDVFVHTGVGPLEWDGNIWLGVGSLATISGMVETVDGGDDRITVGLSGIPIETMPDFVDEFTEEDTAGREWFMYIAVLDENGDIDGEASELNSGTTGAADLVDGPTKAITLSLVTEAALMRAVLFFRMTDEDQQSLYSGDLFFEFMSDLGDELRWGSADPRQLIRDRPGDVSDIGVSRERGRARGQTR